MSSSAAPYQLLYHAGIPGRGEFARLVLEEAGVPYLDTARPTEGEPLPSNAPDDNAAFPSPPARTPPRLKHGDLLVGQTANIVMYLGQQLGLAGQPPAGSGEEADPNAIYKLNLLAMTAIEGMCDEVHETHHPISASLYYEDQVPEAKRRSQHYVKSRLPQYLQYFEDVLGSKASKGGKWLFNGRLSYADLVLFQCLDGLKFSFPKAMAKHGKTYPKVFALYAAVKERPNIKAYLASSRRLPYSNGIYRYYEELDFEV